MDRESIDDAKKVIEKISPEKESRKAYLEMFAECIEEARRHGAEKWGVTLHSDRVGLNVGSLVVCTLHEGYFWVVLPVQPNHSMPSLKFNNNRCDRSHKLADEADRVSVVREIRMLRLTRRELETDP